MGRILTNLFLMLSITPSMTGRSGNHSVSARPRGHDDVEIIFADDGPE